MSKLQSVGSVAGKETIYVDVDDEITAIIDKVGAAKGKVIALVLPKRATVLQSIVNMKILKRTAENADKNLVLVTSEAGLLPLAGSVGLYVASSPTSKPAIPDAPTAVDDGPEDVDEPLSIVDNSAGDDFDAKAVAGTSIGTLAGATAVGKAAAEPEIDESIDMSDGDVAAAAAVPAKVVKPKKNKKLKVPNFDSLKLKIVIGVLALAIIITGWILVVSVLPKATVTIKTDSTTITTNMNLTLDTGVKVLNADDKTVPAVAQSQQKTATQTVDATGQQNNGQKATGSVSFKNCSGAAYTVSAGTSISASSHTYIVQSSVTIPDSNYSHSGACRDDGSGEATARVTALKGGTDYNISSSPATLSGSPSDITGTTTQMTGGTDNITKIVSQTDIDNATNKMKAANSDSVKQQLESNLESKGLLPVDSTFLAGDPSVTTSAKAGDVADNVTVTSVTVFTMLGVQKSDLKTLVVSNVNGQIDKGKQVILDDGVANASFSENTPATTTSAYVSMQAKSKAGPDLNADSLKAQLAGKKAGDVKSYVKQTPGVTDVDVKFSPFWVNAVPKKASKVTISIDKVSS